MTQEEEVMRTLKISVWPFQGSKRLTKPAFVGKQKDKGSESKVTVRLSEARPAPSTRLVRTVSAVRRLGDQTVSQEASPVA